MDDLNSKEFLEIVELGNKNPGLFASLVSSGRTVSPEAALAEAIGDFGGEVSGPRLTCNGSLMSCVSLDDMATKINPPEPEEDEDKPPITN
jgi:hypothetical protein